MIDFQWIWVFVHYGDSDEILYHEEDVYLTKKEADKAMSDFRWVLDYADLVSDDIAVLHCIKTPEGLETEWGQSLTTFKEELL